MLVGVRRWRNAARIVHLFGLLRKLRDEVERLIRRLEELEGLLKKDSYDSEQAAEALFYANSGAVYYWAVSKSGKKLWLPAKACRMIRSPSWCQVTTPPPYDAIP